MQQPTAPVNTIALLTNVSLVMAALERVMGASRNLPRKTVLYGPPGWGKTKAITYAANKYRGYHVRCCNLSTRKSLLTSILKEMGIPAARTMTDMLDQITEELTTSQRPLIIDEVDHLVEKSAIEVIRDIHDLSACSAILLVGEEQLPSKLQKWERFHRRVLEWVPAQPADFQDADQLRRLYIRDGLQVADDILQDILDISGGSAGRITINLEHLQNEAASAGWTYVDRATWGNRLFYTGKAPKRRV